MGLCTRTKGTDTARKINKNKGRGLTRNGLNKEYHNDICSAYQRCMCLFRRPGTHDVAPLLRCSIDWVFTSSPMGCFAAEYTSTMEHTTTMIICKTKPNVSENSVSTRTKIWVLQTYQYIYQTEVNRHKDCEGLEWSK